MLRLSMIMVKSMKKISHFADHAAAVNYLLDKLIELKIVASYDEITAVGH